jgi:hypothetical protein
MQPNYGNKYPLKVIFLDAFSKIGLIKNACAVSGISESTFYRWLSEDSKFESGYIKAGKEAYRANRENLSMVPKQKQASIIKAIFEDEAGWMESNN